MTTKKEAADRISAIKKEIDALVTEAELLCDATGYDGFYLDVAYGMGGSYRPDPRGVEKWEDSPDDYEIIMDDDGEWKYEYTGNYDSEEGGYWNSSSSSC